MDDGAVRPGDRGHDEADRQPGLDGRQLGVNEATFSRDLHRRFFSASA